MPGISLALVGNEASDFALTASSPAIDRGLLLGYEADFRGTKTATNALPDLGAFEFVKPTTR